MIVERTFLLVLSNLIMVALLYFSLKPALKGRFVQWKLLWIFPIILIFCLFSFWGSDWFHYLESYELLKWRSDLPSQFEDLYRYIIEWTPSYLYFRLTIWGTALVLTFYAFRLLKLDMGLATFYFVVCSLIWFSYGRVSLAFAFSFLGFSFLVSGCNKLTSILFGVALVAVSLYCHKSSVFIIAIICITFIIDRLPLNVYRLLLILFPIFAILLTVLLGNFLTVMIDDESNMTQTVSYGQRYLSHESRGISFSSLGQIPSKILEWLPKYFVAYICFKTIKCNNRETPKSIRYFCIMFFLIIYSSSFFLFDIGYSTNIIFSRFQRFAILPEVVVMTYFYNNVNFRYITKKAHILFCISTFYTLLYQTYCSAH